MSDATLNLILGLAMITMVAALVVSSVLNHRRAKRRDDRDYELALERNAILDRNSQPSSLTKAINHAAQIRRAQVKNPRTGEYQDVPVEGGENRG